MMPLAVVAVILAILVVPNDCKSSPGVKKTKDKDLKINHPYYNDPAAPMRAVYGQTVEETSKELNKAIDDAVNEASKNVMSDNGPFEIQASTKSKSAKHSKKAGIHKNKKLQKKFYQKKVKSDDEMYLEEIKRVLPKNEDFDKEDTKDSEAALFTDSTSTKKSKSKALEKILNKSKEKLKKNASLKKKDKKKGADLEETEDIIEKVGEEGEEAPTTAEYVNQDPEETGSPEDNTGSEEDEEPSNPEVTPSASANEEAPEPESQAENAPSSDGNAPLPAQAPQPPVQAPQYPGEAPQYPGEAPQSAPAAPQPGAPDDGNQQDLKKLLDESISNLIKANAAVETLLKATDYRDRVLPTLTYPCDTCTLICLPGCDQSCCPAKNIQQQRIFPPAPTMPILPPPDPPMVLPLKPQPPVICCDSVTIPLSDLVCTGQCQNQNCIYCDKTYPQTF